MSMMQDANDLASAKNYVKEHAKDDKFKNKKFGDSYAYRKKGENAKVLSNGTVSNGKIFEFKDGNFTSRNADSKEIFNVGSMFKRAKRIDVVGVVDKGGSKGGKRASTGRSSG